MIGELEFDFSVIFGFILDGILFKLFEFVWVVERISLKGLRIYIYILVYVMLLVWIWKVGVEIILEKEDYLKK